jgi:hypothetical protein
MLQQPRHKLRVRENQSEHTADQVEMSCFHRCIIARSDEISRASSARF